MAGYEGPSRPVDGRSTLKDGGDMSRGFRILDRAPWGLIGAVVVAMAVESFVDRHPSAFMHSHELDWRAAGREAAGPAVKRAEVLLFGDSMVKFGINPGLLQQRLGRRAHGLALLNGRPGASYFLLKRAIEAGARPKLVVVDYQPECMFEKTPHLLDQREWKGLLTLRECFDLALAHRDPNFLGRSVAARLLPSYRSRGEIGRTVMADLRAEPRPNLSENAKVGRNRAVNRGGMVLAPQPGYQGEVSEQALNVVAAPDWFVRPENVIYVRRFLDLASAHGVPVVWLLPPNVPAVEAERARRGVADRYAEFVRRAQARVPSLKVIDARYSGFGHELFVDAVHLNRHGAAELTRGVADVLAGWLDGGRGQARWATLPPPVGAGASEAVALEDVDQSRAALGAVRR